MRFYEKQFENNFEELITYYPRFYRGVYEMVEILRANGRVLFAGEGAYRKKWALPAFLLCTEVLVLFGDYSYYTVENFMIARSRQGKAALGSILIPMIFFLLLTLLRKIQEEQKITVGFWVLLGSVMTACCLASTMGALLACMLVGTAGLCGAVSYRKWKLILPLIGCCIPCIVYAGMYLLLG